MVDVSVIPVVIAVNLVGYPLASVLTSLTIISTNFLSSLLRNLIRLPADNPWGAVVSKVVVVTSSIVTESVEGSNPVTSE